MNHRKCGSEGRREEKEEKREMVKEKDEEEARTKGKEKKEKKKEEEKEKEEEEGVNGVLFVEKGWWASRVDDEKKRIENELLSHLHKKMKV
jgi:hypothetical protein